MSDEPARRAGQESYFIADAEAQVAYVRGRRATVWVPFLLPHLQPGMRLLDAGCGVGSITLDLAELVAPGETVGMDQDASQLEIARASAASRGVASARFALGDAYALPFPDASFDAVLAHTLLVHLSDPLRALKEFHRVLRPGGIVAVSDDQDATWVVSPQDSVARTIIAELGPKAIVASGGSPFYSHNLRRLLLDAGFARTEGHAVAAECYGTLQETRRFAAIISQQMTNPQVIARTVAAGLATAEELEAMRLEALAWGERPDAYAAILYCAALGWVEGASAPSE